MTVRILIGFSVLLLGITSCSTKVVKSTSYTQVIQDGQYLSEDLLLDIGVAVFDPGLDELSSDDEELTNHQVRLAESRYASFLLAETLQRSGNWGIVRVLPNETGAMDLHVDGTILESNGEAMTMRVTVSDSTGEQWYTREYREVISEFNYDQSQRKLNDPFQVMYNTIANDLLAFRKDNVTDSEITEIRAVSQVLFAQRFAPRAFDGYLSQDRDGIYQVNRLPAANDPLLERIQTIRERDYMFIDTVQDYYATYARQMKLPYDSWREQSYHETIELRELETSARRRFITGTAVVLGGIAAATSGNYAMQNGGAVGVGAGAYVIKSGFDKLAEARIHTQALEELGDSLESEVAPNVISLDDRTITLTGTVEEQYDQWREILADIYAVETGES
ncbi:MAG: hypothetical protein WDZ76_14000 [Pseudohongiellaceae bacterium]